MPAITVQFLTDGESALRVGEHIAVHDNASQWRAVLIPNGMASGEPSVALIVPIPHERDGAVVVLETSLLTLRAAARALEAMAEARLGWTLPA